MNDLKPGMEVRLDATEKAEPVRICGNPGSKEAVACGCICPRIDNSYGAGYGRPGQFIIFSDCPIHGMPNPSDSPT